MLSEAGLFASKILACQNMGKPINFGTHLVGFQKVAHLTKCYSEIAKVLVKKICMPMFQHAQILVAHLGCLQQPIHKATQTQNGSYIEKKRPPTEQAKE